MMNSKKHFYTLVGCAVVTASLASCGSTQSQDKSGPELGPNLVRDGGFEENGAAWSLKTAKVVSGQAHSGKRSLEYTNKNPQNYQLIQQNIPVQPGQLLHFSALVKGENVTTSSLWQAKGAGVFVQSYDADGKYINGAFPFTLPGTFDWTPVKGFYIVPPQARRTVLGLYLRSATVGRVWFDDVTVQVEQPRLLQAFLQYPNYRGITTPQSKNSWQLLIKNQLPTEWKSATLSHRIKDSTGKVIFEGRQTISPANEQIVRWKPTQPLKNGEYSWQVEIVSPDNRKSEWQQFAIRVQPEMPRVYIDAQGFTRIDGERFFPLGIYTGKSKGGVITTSPEHLKRMSDAGLNTILSYLYGERSGAEQFVDEANRHNLKVIYNLTDLYDGWQNFTHMDRSATHRALKLVEKFKDHPALLAWYINDELGLGEVPSLEERYGEIAALDYHPVYHVQNKLNVLPWNYSSSDVIGTDPYPARSANSQLGVVTRYVNTTSEVAAGSKGIWQVTQIHNHSLHKDTGVGEAPSLDQMRNMAYQNLIGGAKGLHLWSYHWLPLTRGANKTRVFSEAEYERRWLDVKKMVQEIKPILLVILKDQKIVLQRTAASTASYQAWQDADQLYVMVANPNPEAAALDLQIPAGWRLADQSHAGIAPQLAGQKLRLDLSPIASGVVVLKR